MLPRALVLAAVAFLSILNSANATGVSQRTFVASYGNDANPCSLVLPCRAFAAAISQTLKGGEVIVLDSAGYGQITIKQSVSIIAPAGVYAGISVPLDQTGVAINGEGAIVVLRGLTISGFGGGVGPVGILMTNGAFLGVEACTISDFSSHIGIEIQTPALVKIAGSVFTNNSLAILAGYGSSVNVADSQIFKSGDAGVALYGGTVGTTNIFISDSLINGTGPGRNGLCVVNQASPGTSGNISLTRVTVTGCLTGLLNQPSEDSGTMTLSNSIVTANGYGLQALSGTFYSLGNSQVSGNTTDTSGAITTIGGQ